MIKACPGKNTIKGIDIYHGDLIQDINQVKASGVEYAMLKAYEQSADPSFAFRWNALKNDGLIVGAYDFFHPENSAIAQAKSFCSIVGPLRSGDMCSWLDWERSGGTNQMGLDWLNEVEQIQGFTPGIYASPYFLKDKNLDKRFARFPLWIAEYGVTCPWIPAPWTTFQFWQTTGTGSVAGMKGNVDRDIFNGTIDQLKLLTVK